MTLWQRGSEAIGPTPVNFKQSGNVFLLGNFSSEDTKFGNLGLKIFSLDEFGCKIEILSTRNLFCGKFAALCRNIATLCPLPQFF